MSTDRTETSHPSLSVTHLRCEYKVDPLGIDALPPRLSWQIVSPVRGTRQSAYQIQVAEDAEALAAGAGLLWDSGRVASDASIHVPYQGPALASGQRCYWRVRAWDASGQPSAWSEPASWEMGLLQPADWQAAWIQPDLQEDTSDSAPCPMLRTTFHLEGAVRSARAYITSLGLYQAELNGQPVGDQVLAPGWTSYDTRVQYQVYDVRDLLASGENAIGVTLGDGWYRGYIGFRGQRNAYGSQLALLLQLAIVYEDGRVQWVCSDEGWRCATGPILRSDIYNGESYDARLEKVGWSEPGYDDSDWSGVTIAGHSQEILVAPAGPPMRRIEKIKPVEVLHTPAGETVFDLGQNMVGWVRLRVQDEAGTTVTLRHAEVLDQEGNLYTANLRSAQQTDTYTLKGGGVEVYEPHFTFHGFRYVAVDGYPGEPALDALTGIVVHSDMTPTGQFGCDNPSINQLQHNVAWGQKGNFVDVPTDCPQRDERLGWTGDAQVFIRTACFNAEVAGFFTKWLRDVAADQHDDGAVPFVVPDVLGRARGGAAGSAAWGDAAVICPWTIYLCYGDTCILEEQYDSMRAWVDYIAEKAGDGYLWNTGFHFGDWLSYNSPDPAGSSAITDKDVVATAFFGYSTSLLQQAAQVLGKDEDARRYADLLANVKRAFGQEFVTPNGRVANNTQTAYALALMFDLLPLEQRPEAARRLAADVRRRGNHLSTGFAGTPYLCHVLSQNGYLDVAYDLLNQDTYPSWLYPVGQGATTIWERWDGIKPDGSFQDPGMNSFNHYAYGAIGEWLYRVVAGLEVDADAPGYKHVLVEPQPGGGLTRAHATLNTMYGQVASEWQIVEDRFQLRVVVPANTRATVRLPAARLDRVTEGGQPLDGVQGIERAAQEGDAVVVELGSGSYLFAYSSDVFAEYTRYLNVLSTRTKLSKLLADPGAKEVLSRHVPDLLVAPQLRMAMHITLREVAGYVPDMLNDQVLDAIDEELARL
jgi:alpha-L-rhamnosidase